jgi:predicted acyltransferase
MKERQVAIDFVRGLTIALMMVVNNPGTWAAVYPPLLHAEWHGCTLTDLVFPFFLFIVGSSMWFSLSSTETKLNTAVFQKIAKRAALLVLLGLLLAKFPFFHRDWHLWRFMGVLQRIGICYFFAALLVITLSVRQVIAVAASLLLAYWAMLYFWHPSDPFSLEHNLVRMIDVTIMGENHVWKGKGIPFDPEGLLSTIPSVVTVLLGWWAARIIGTNKHDRALAFRTLIYTGVALTVAGLIWSLVFPLNKYIWSSSYTLYTGGLATLLLGVSLWVLDIKLWRRWADFFLIYGTNPLFAYILAGVIVKTWINIKWTDASKKSGFTNVYQWLYSHTWGAIYEGKFGSMFFSFSFCLLIWLVCLYLYRRKVFIKI